MSVLEEAQRMLEKYPLCDHCLGRQFALLGHGVENEERGKAIKLALTFEAHALALSESKQDVKVLKVLATNGFSKTAREIINRMGERVEAVDIPEKCFLCEGKLDIRDDFAEKALGLLEEYEYSSFLVGIELPLIVAEREDEFRAEFGVNYGESLRKEFARTVGKRIAERSGKDVDFKKPEVVVLVEPFSGLVRLQVNPLFVAGRYRKLVRSIPQSKWFCSECWGKGCVKCNWTGKMYPESVQEIVEKPLLEATNGAGASFHASGREDIDARMLGNGRPFVIEIATPKKRFLDLKKTEDAVNAYGLNKVEVSGLRLANKDVVRKLKGDESKQKEYRVFIEFENKITAKDMHFLEKSLTNVMIKQKTPVRVLHRRADLTREKYIYDVDVKKLSPRKAEMRLRCQGGLYVKELVTGDEGRTVPSVSELLKNKAKPMELDVLNIVMED
jgi:tRNA pseudouridine synthase 10